MSQANDHSHDGEQDVVESIVPLMPIVLPVAGGSAAFSLLLRPKYQTQVGALAPSRSSSPRSRG